MKHFFILTTAILVASFNATARPVDQATAQAIAAKFMETNNLQLVTTYQTDKNIVAFYVFNTSDGFVIVSADDCETPIIGYSHEGQFDSNDVPIQLQGYLQDFAARIQYGIDNHIVADKITARQWNLVKATGRLNDRKSTKAVAPLLTNKWHQGCLYNSLCPTMQGPCDHAEVGCVAVAMGQIMHYWGYPSTGWGSHSYTNAGSTLSADFGNTTYDWSHMPDLLTENSSDEEIQAVATLLYHCGVSTDMRYTTNGSLANSSDIPRSLTRYFNYSRHQLHREKKNDYSNEEWMALLKNCLDLQRPIQYSGYGSSAGHAFVCDGYDENDLLHFNWGWGGNADGYFALGNLNPLGYEFNNSNTALLDIVPENDPCVVIAMAYPPTAGAIEGAGEYHIGEQCTLTAISSEDYMFHSWKKNGQVISNEPSFTFTVEDDTIHFEALFSCFPVGQITANYPPETNNPNGSCVNLSWSRANTDWFLLKQFETDEECSGVVTDGKHIYVTYGEWNSPAFAFGKYTMEGELVEKFNLENNFNAVGLAYDGTSFYCNCGRSGLKVIYRVDLENKMIIDSTDMGIWFGDFTYDPDYDGFWLGQNYKIILYSRQGQSIKSSPTLPDYIYGSGYYTAEDGSPHMLLSREPGIYDYDLTNNVILNRPLLNPGWDYTYGVGANIAKYDGKDAMFINNDHSIRIYEIKSQFAQIREYRIYRSDSEGQIVMLADEVGGLAYIDNTWSNAPVGVYRFGISEVYANGVESEIVWSEPVEKTNIGINEVIIDPEDSSVQKVFENGQIVIIKDGKRYSVSGQKLN